MDVSQAGAPSTLDLYLFTCGNHQKKKEDAILFQKKGSYPIVEQWPFGWPFGNRALVHGLAFLFEELNCFTSYVSSLTFAYEFVNGVCS